jgi:hypothetical protein
VNKVEESRCVFVESREDTSVIFEFSDEAFDVTALFIKRIIAVLGCIAIGFGRDAGRGTNAARSLKVYIRIIAAIRQHRMGFSALHQARPHRAVRRSTGRKNELQRIAKRVRT